MPFALGVVLSSAVFFVWSAISWMVLPWQRAQFKRFVSDDRVGELRPDAPLPPEAGR